MPGVDHCWLEEGSQWDEVITLVFLAKWLQQRVGRQLGSSSQEAAARRGEAEPVQVGEVGRDDGRQTQRAALEDWRGGCALAVLTLDRTE